MSTKSHINPFTAPKELSPMRAAAVVLFSSPSFREVDVNQLYDLAAAQPTSILTDVPMSNPKSIGLSSGRDRVIANFTGQDTARSAWARRYLPTSKEIEEDPSLLSEKENLEKLIREVNYQVLRGDFGPFIKRSYFVGKNQNFMLKLNYAVPETHAKLALDAELNFIQINERTKELYEQSVQLDVPDMMVVCVPEWENPEWRAWLDAGKQGKEPPRIMMVFDTENYVAYLLGGRYFGETKKAVLSLTWHIAVQEGIGMPVHGSSKTLFTKEGTTSFITIGLSGSGKSTIGNDPHEEWLNWNEGERVHLGNDDALLILFEPQDKTRAVVGLESGLYNKSNDYSPDSFYIGTVQTAENCLVARDGNNRLIIIHEDVFAGNGRVESDRYRLKGADDDFDTPWPNYYSLIMKDESLPPLMLIEDDALFAAMYMSLATRSTTAENVPPEERKKLKIVPGAQPFNLWSYKKEAELIRKTMKTVGFKGLVLNTGYFFRGEDELIKVPKELTLSIYPLLARGELTFEPWEIFPHTALPNNETMEKVFPGFIEKFDPRKLSGDSLTQWKELAIARIETRIEFLKHNIGLSQDYIAPLYEVLNRMQKN